MNAFLVRDFLLLCTSISVSFLHIPFLHHVLKSSPNIKKLKAYQEQMTKQIYVGKKFKICFTKGFNNISNKQSDENSKEAIQRDCLMRLGRPADGFIR
jgi:hypothetical protein